MTEKVYKQQVEWVLEKTNFRRDGFFLEMGATDGVDRSNTLLLEREYGWIGILAEPDRRYREVLPYIRPNSSIEFDCVWSTTGETKIFYQSNGLDDQRSTLEEYSTLGDAPRIEKDWKTYPVQTISLTDLLKKHNAPKYIDYFSLDTEGSELEILKAFDFEQYQFGCITVEHNQRKSYMKEVRDFLYSKGYYIPKDSEGIFEWDDGFVSDHIVKAL